MANHLSALKRARQTERRTVRNRANTSSLRTQLRLLRETIEKGDKAAAGAADLLVLETDATGFKEGSARERQVTTVAGATTIKVHIKLLDKDGKVVLERDVQGKVHFFGENMNATHALAKSIAKVLKENFIAPRPGATS